MRVHESNIRSINNALESNSGTYDGGFFGELCVGFQTAWYLWLITLYFLCPAFIVAQNRNCVIIPMCPNLISSSVGLSYLIPFVLLPIPILIGIFARKYDSCGILLLSGIWG